jgi:CRISPR/Cas system-associated exonuclease Cas4 (RecB family)
MDKKQFEIASGLRQEAVLQIGPRLIKISFPDVLQVSHSKIKKWRRCRRAFHYRYVQHLKPRVKRTPLLKGSVLDKAIGAWMAGKDWRKVLVEFEKEFKKLFPEERAELGDLPTMMNTIVEGYASFYANDGMRYLKRRHGKVTQIPIRIYLDNRTLFIGYIDAYPQDRQGRNWLLDTKSTKRMPGEEGRFHDIQFVFYVWALARLGYPIPDGVIWDYVRSEVPKKPRPGSVAYRRVRLPNPSRQMISSVIKDMLSTAEEIRRVGTTDATRSPDWTCSMCEYATLCAADLRGLDTTFMLRKDFTIDGKPARRAVEEEEELE